MYEGGKTEDGFQLGLPESEDIIVNLVLEDFNDFSSSVRQLDLHCISICVYTYGEL